MFRGNVSGFPVGSQLGFQVGVRSAAMFALVEPESLGRRRFPTTRWCRNRFPSPLSFTGECPRHSFRRFTEDWSVSSPLEKSGLIH